MPPLYHVGWWLVVRSSTTNEQPPTRLQRAAAVAAPIGAAGGMSSVNCRSGCIRNALTAPSISTPIAMTNGSCGSPVTSVTQPATTGDRIAARAEPEFIRPDAVPEYLGAMSIGIAHIGPITISAKKNPAERHTATNTLSLVCRIGSSERRAPTKPNTAAPTRALRTLLVLWRMRSESTPPMVLPTAPMVKTIVANNAVSFVLSENLSLKKMSRKLRYDQRHQP